MRRSRLRRLIRFRWPLTENGTVTLILLLAALAFMGWVAGSNWGCTGLRTGRALSPEDVAAVVAGVAEVQQNEAGGDIVNQQFDQWGPRLDAMSRFVEALRKWSIWLVLGVPFAAYVAPKIGWLVVQRCIGKVNGKKLS